MGGLREERFGGSGGVENEGGQRRLVETTVKWDQKNGKKSTTGVGVNLTPDFMNKEESNSHFKQVL